MGLWQENRDQDKGEYGVMAGVIGMQGVTGKRIMYVLLIKCMIFN